LANTGHGSDVSPGRDALLNQVSVLIVEDEPFIALDLATAVEEARGKVIGPAGSVREGLMLIERHLVQAAVLDVNLSDRDVTPIAELLIECGVPVIFYSGLALPAALRERYPCASAYRKPTPPVELLNKLVALMCRQSGDGVILAVGAWPAAGSGQAGP
jgi:DNA-binding response OmpR family regulator